MKKYKKYKDNPEYEFVPYSNTPQYDMGGTNDIDPEPKKVYTNKAEFDKANEKYKDSLAIYNYSHNNIMKKNISMLKDWTAYKYDKKNINNGFAKDLDPISDFYTNINILKKEEQRNVPLYQSNQLINAAVWAGTGNDLPENIKKIQEYIKPVGSMGHMQGTNAQGMNIVYRKPTVKPEYQPKQKVIPYSKNKGNNNTTDKYEKVSTGPLNDGTQREGYSWKLKETKGLKSIKPTVTLPTSVALPAPVTPAPVTVPKVNTKFQIQETNFGAPIQYQFNATTGQYFPITGIPKDTPQSDITTIPFVNEMKKYAMGGSNSNKLHKFGQFAGNALKTSADSMLSTFGLDNVISDDMYKGGSANDFIKIGNVMGGINKTFASTAAGILGGPAAGAAVSGIQQVGSQFNPEEEQQQDMQYAMGGMYQGQPNAEIEGGGNGTAGEVVNYPDGTTDQAFGETHEKGGVKVHLPEATRIFTNRIKIGKRTIAKIAQRYKTNKEEAILKDTTSNSLQKKTAELNMFVKNKILDKIFNIQEMMKSRKINRYIKRYGGTQMYAEGGSSNLPASKLQYVSEQSVSQNNNNYTNKFEDYTKDTDINSGDISRGYNRSTNDPNKTPYIGYYNDKGTTELNIAGPNGSIYPKTDLFMNNYLNNKIDTKVNQQKYGGIIKMYNGGKMKYPYGGTPEETDGSMLGKAGTEIGLGLLNNAGNLAYLAQNGRDYDKVDYGSVTPELPTDRESQNAIREAYSTAAYNLRNSGQQTQAGQVALGNVNMKESANSRERIGNTIADIRNRTNMFNKQIQIRGTENEAENKGVAESNYYTALNSIGQNIASQRGDYLSGQMDQKKLNLILEYFPDYELDPKTFQYMYRSSLQQSKIKK